MLKQVKRWPLFLLAWGVLSLALLGIFLPLLPTTPFLLLAAWLFSRSYPPMHAWLQGHKTLGPPLRRWEEHGGISLKSKGAATLLIGLVLIFTLSSQLALIVKVLFGLIVAAVLLFLWTRPAGPPKEQ